MKQSTGIAQMVRENVKPNAGLSLHTLQTKLSVHLNITTEIVLYKIYKHSKESESREGK